jgi:hypothetical protein
MSAPAFATLNDSEEPGSVLVFPKFLRGTVATPDLAGAGQPFSARTEIEISVSCPKGSTCTRDPFTGFFFDRVRLRAHWVCGGNNDVICQERDFDLFTTVNGTIAFNAENVPTRPFQITAVPVPPCDKGYLIVWVVDQFGQPIKFDGLVGDAIIREGDNSAGAYNAIPIQASPFLNTGDLTDVNMDGHLDFDGSEYSILTGKVIGTVRYNVPNPFGGNQVETFLTLLTLDVRSNRINNPTFVDLDFFNESESVRSNFTLFFCWEEVSLTDIDEGLVFDPFGASMFGNFGRKGLLVSGAAEKELFIGDDKTGPVTLLGIIETKERDPSGAPIREYSYSLYNDSEPVPTAFEPNSP